MSAEREGRENIAADLKASERRAERSGETGGNVILFIDETSTMVGAGKADGAMDARNMHRTSAGVVNYLLCGLTLDEYRQLRLRKKTRRWGAVSKSV